ncbi:hypothetical protein Tco_0387112 [Tanacetum coccineum]
MRTRSRFYPNNNSSIIPRRNRRRSQQQVPPNLVEPPKDTMADQRTMAELLQAPTEGYEDAIVVPAITADNFELKHGLLTLVRIYQKSQDNRQKRANTDTKNGRAQKKPEMQRQSQEKSKSQSYGQPPVNLGQQKSTHKRTDPQKITTLVP